MKRKLVVFFMVLCLIIPFATILVAGEKKEEEPSEKKLVISYVLWSQNDAWQISAAKWAKKYAEELGVEMITLDGQMNPETQVEVMEDLIVKGVDGIIIQAVDPPLLRSTIVAAQDAGIPVVSFVNPGNAPTVLIPEKHTSIQMGEMCATKWMEFYPDKRIYIGTIGDPALEWAHESRTKGFVEGVMNVAPDAEWVANLGKTSREAAVAAAEDILQAHPEVNMVFGFNMENSLAALGVFRASGRGKAKDGIPITEMFAGFAASELELREIADPNSPYAATVALSPKKTTYANIDLLLKIIAGEVDMYSLEDNVSVYSDILDKWNSSVEDMEKWFYDANFVEINLSQ
jgi:ribose transport system substrate-binding protein